MLAIAGGKGGCGKTTTAIGVALALARQGHDPLVVDADADMPDIHERVGIDPTPSLDALTTGRQLPEVARRPPRFPRLAVLTGGSRDGLDALDHTRAWQGPVILDCAPGCDRTAMKPLRASERSLLVTTDRPESVEDALKTAAAARRLGARPVGALVRDTCDRTVSLQLPVLARTPTVDAPLTDERTETAFERVATDVCLT